MEQDVWKKSLLIENLNHIHHSALTKWSSVKMFHNENFLSVANDLFISTVTDPVRMYQCEWSQRRPSWFSERTSV